MLSDPNDSSPANIDAAVNHFYISSNYFLFDVLIVGVSFCQVMWRTDRTAFKKKVREVVRRSQEE